MFSVFISKIGLLSVTPHNFFTGLKKFFSPYQLHVCLTVSCKPVGVTGCCPTFGILSGCFKPPMRHSARVVFWVLATNKYTCNPALTHLKGITKATNPPISYSVA